MDGEDTAWLTVLEKKGLHQVAGILENYGIDSETDVSLLERKSIILSVSLIPVNVIDYHFHLILP